MTRRALVLMCCVLVFATSMTAQSRGAKADPLSGTWKGELDVPAAPNPVAVTLELKFDGKSKVTGTFTGLPNPGDVKTGTFNPDTGALKLGLGKTGNTEVLIILEGKVVNGVASGSVEGEPGTGTFKITKKV